MLDLNAPVRTIAGVDLAVDESEERAFFVLPPAPRVAREFGAPSVELLRFIRAGQLTGGHLRIAVELSHRPETLSEVERILAEELNEDPLLQPAPVQAATAELLFVGRETNEEGGISGLLRRGYGRTPAHTQPPHRATFSVGLEPDGVRLVEAALRAGGAPVGVIYRLSVEGLWPALRVVGRVDWARAYEHFSSHAKNGVLLSVSDIRRISEKLIEERVVQISAVESIVPGEGENAADAEPVLGWFQRQLVEQFCEPVMPLSREPARASLGSVGEVLGVGVSYAVKARVQIERVLGEIDFNRARVIGRTWTAHAHLADLLDGGLADAHISDAGTEHPFFQRMRLHVDSTRPLAENHLKEVVVNFGYGAEHEAKALTGEQAEVTFDAWRDASEDRIWELRGQATFTDVAPVDAGRQVELPPITGRSRELTLDFGTLLGLVAIEVRGPPDERVAVSRVRLVHSREGEQLAERDLLVTPEVAAKTVWFRDIRPGDLLDAKTQHLLASGRIIEGASLPVDTQIFRLPPPFPGSMTIQLMGDDDWTDLERVVVAVQKTDDHQTGTFEFNQPGQLHAVSLDMPDPADRTYRYRTSRTWSSGVVEEDDWVETDASVLLVGRTAANRLVVDLWPVGPELPQAGIHDIQVDLLYVDVANQLRESHTQLIRAVSERPRWIIPITDPRRREYEYRITVHRTSGEEQIGRWTKARERILPIPVASTA